MPPMIVPASLIATGTIQKPNVLRSTTPRASLYSHPVVAAGTYPSVRRAPTISPTLLMPVAYEDGSPGSRGSSSTT